MLQRPRFRRVATSIDPVLRFVRESGLWVRPTEILRVCSDPDDDMFLECAQEARASWLVTGNVRDVPAAWQDTRIVTPRQFLGSLLAEAERS